MKTKTILILSICLLLFACGKKKETNEKIKQKTIVKTTEKPKQKIKTENILNALPAKKDEHVHSPTCGHKQGAASQVHVDMMAKAQQERMELAEMLPEEIREKIAKMVAERDVNGLAEMCGQLSRIGDYDNAFLIASNFLAHAETETEKQMATSFYANLMAREFIDNNKNHNNKKYDNVKKHLINSIENMPDNPDVSQTALLNNSLFYLPKILKYKMDIDAMYKTYNESIPKINELSKESKDIIKYNTFLNAYNLFLKKKNYDDIKISNNNLELLLKFSEEIDSGNVSPTFDFFFSPKQRAKIKVNILNFKKYRDKRRIQNEN